MILYNNIKYVPIIGFLFFYNACVTDKYEIKEGLEGFSNDEFMPGGATTTEKMVFDDPAPNLEEKPLALHDEGDAEFEQIFVPSKSLKGGGLGPIFNNNSCISCHIGDGRSAIPPNLDMPSGFFLRVSIGNDLISGSIPVEGFGLQIQHRAEYGTNIKREAGFQIIYTDTVVIFPDGEKITLRKPIYSLRDSYRALPEGVLISPRVAPPVFGVGLLEAITESSIRKLEDINDANKDDISGKVQMVWDETQKKSRVGRFGWKGDAPSTLIQVAAAFHSDMGLTNSVFPDKSAYYQIPNYKRQPPNITDDILKAMVFYCQTLAVPAPRFVQKKEVMRGKFLFKQIKCNSCHTPSYITGVLEGVPEVSNQKIYPYTDMLLHDMGEGLADNRPVNLADGREWQTRPLWGIGLTEHISNTFELLHDGRARGIQEAILWHGGEASKSVIAFKNLPKKDREALLEFVSAL